MNPTQIVSIAGAGAALVSAAIGAFNGFHALKLNAALADLRREIAERDLAALKDQLLREEQAKLWTEKHFVQRAAP